MSWNLPSAGEKKPEEDGRAEGIRGGGASTSASVYGAAMRKDALGGSGVELRFMEKATVGRFGHIVRKKRDNCIK